MSFVDRLKNKRHSSELEARAMYGRLIAKEAAGKLRPADEAQLEQLAERLKCSPEDIARHVDAVRFVEGRRKIVAEALAAEQALAAVEEELRVHNAKYEQVVAPLREAGAALDARAAALRQGRPDRVWAEGRIAERMDAEPLAFGLPEPSPRVQDELTVAAEQRQRDADLELTLRLEGLPAFVRDGGNNDLAWNSLSPEQFVWLKQGFERGLPTCTGLAPPPKTHDPVKTLVPRFKSALELDAEAAIAARGDFSDHRPHAEKVAEEMTRLRRVLDGEEPPLESIRHRPAVVGRVPE